MKTLTLQQILNKVVKHFIWQDKPYGYLNERTGCIYRMETGNKKLVLRCALGICIPKSLYNKAMESESGRYLTSYFPELRQIFDPEDAQALNALQKAHDACAIKKKSKEEFYFELKGFAEDHGLVIPSMVP